MDEIFQATGVKLEFVGNANFNWMIGKDNVTSDKQISGVSYELKDVSRDKTFEVEKFLRETYEEDLYNMADGVVGGLRGYIVNYMACDLNFRHVETKENEYGMTEPVGDKMNLSLACGYFNKNEVADLLDQRLIEQQFAKKYKKVISEVKVTFLKKDETYASGSVKFGTDENAGGGMFLAVNKGGSWQLVYDGNGSVDCEAMRTTYNFSDEFLKPNFCD